MPYSVPTAPARPLSPISSWAVAAICLLRVKSVFQGQLINAMAIHERARLGGRTPDEAVDVVISGLLR